jgi:hypothetical protein
MYTLILVFSLKSMYNQNIDTLVVPNLVSDKECLTLGRTLRTDMLELNSDIKVQVYCEETPIELEIK